MPKKQPARTTAGVISKEGNVVIEAPNMETAQFDIYGIGPYVQNKFSEKAKKQMLDAQTSSAAKSRRNKEPRDLDADYEGAIHQNEMGIAGIPAPAFRSALISACRVAGFQMTKAKLSVFVDADFYDEDDGTPLVLIEGQHERHLGHVRLESGVASIAVRPMWKHWAASPIITWDADQFSKQDMANLLERAGRQVGIGEGRPDSRKSHGMGWGQFTLEKPEGWKAPKKQAGAKKRATTKKKTTTTRKRKK